MATILVALTVLSLGVPTYAATDEDQFKKLLNQTTVAAGLTLSEIVQKAKVACVCMSEQGNSIAGVLVRRRTGDDRVSFTTSCFALSFETDGSAIAFFECLDWQLLAKSP
jgi:hypothetical protein